MFPVTNSLYASVFQYLNRNNKEGEFYFPKFYELLQPLKNWWKFHIENGVWSHLKGSRDTISASFKSRVRLLLRLTSCRNCEHPGSVAREIVGQRQHQQKLLEFSQIQKPEQI